MTEETKKPSPLSKIVGILDKMSLKDATDTWQLTGDWLHQKIDKHKDELNDLQKKVPKQEK